MILQNLLFVAPTLAPAWIQTESNAGNQQVRAVAELLAERCIDCHAPDSGKRKAIRKWADAGDLAATVADPDLVVPGDPGASDLYLSVELDDMPPPDSDVTPLTSDEKALIAAWITAGAPLATSEGPSADEPTPTAPETPVDALPPTENSGSAPVEESGQETTIPSASQPKRDEGPEQPAPEASTRSGQSAASQSWLQGAFFRFFGRFHPVVVHFPIALLIAALLAELGVRSGRLRHGAATAEFCLGLGALAALPAVACGWFLGENGSYQTGELFWHRWLGVATMGATWIGWWGIHRFPKARLGIFFVLAGLVGLTGHLGGELTYGDDWFVWP